jgi:hypothetical protein
VLLPLFGSILFIVLYIIAALLYPGGSETNKTTVGFSLINNYWCNLLYKNAINGQINTGLPFAIAAMFILIIALSAFWFLFPQQLVLEKYHKLIIQITGIAGVISCFLLLTDLNHDLVINTASSLGFIAIIGTIVALYKTKWYGLFVFGLFNVLLVVLNNYLYHAKGMMIYLPVVQKISFLSFLFWICSIALMIFKREFKN